MPQHHQAQPSLSEPYEQATQQEGRIQTSYLRQGNFDLEAGPGLDSKDLIKMKERQREGEGEERKKERKEKQL